MFLFLELFCIQFKKKKIFFFFANILQFQTRESKEQNDLGFLKKSSCMKQEDFSKEAI